MSDSYIRDSSFSGSAILSYGRSGNLSVWLKFLALFAGIFAFFILVFCLWFWYFTRIDIPALSAIRVLVPANQPLPAKAPAVWRETHQANAPLPTLMGVVYDSTNRTATPYAVRLSLIRGLFTSERIWRIVIDAGHETRDLGLETQDASEVLAWSPYSLFGLPWSLPAQTHLRADADRFFPDSTSDASLQFSGHLDGAVWYTDYPLSGDFVQSLTLFNQTTSSGSHIPVFSSDLSGLITNILAFYGEYADFSKPTILQWTRDAIGLSVNLEPGSTEHSASGTAFIRRPYTLEDGDVVFRLYRDEISTTTSAIASSVHDMVFPVDTITASDSFITGKTSACPGSAFAVFDRPSVDRICSWFDICYSDISLLIFSNAQSKLVICGF